MTLSAVPDPYHSGDDGLPKPIDWYDLFAEGERERRWLIEDVWPDGRQVHMFAKHKTGKSLLMLWIAACLAAGRDPFTGRPTERRIIIYLDYEMTEDDIHDRLHDMGFAADDLADHLFYYLLPSIPPLDTAEGGTALLTLVARDKPSAVIIDTYSRVTEGDENSNDTTRNFFRHTGGKLKAAGVAMARLDHEGHTGGRSRGGSAKHDDVDVVWQLARTDRGLTLKRYASRLAWVAEQVDLQQGDDPLSFHRVEEAWPAGTADKAAELDSIDVPLDASRKKASEAMKDAGLTPGRSEILSKALDYRRRAAENGQTT